MLGLVAGAFEDAFNVHYLPEGGGGGGGGEERLVISDHLA